MGLFEAYFTSQNSQESFKWFEKAAMQGCPNAQYVLGVMYKKGEGIPPNDSKALYWTEKSAQQGNPTAEITMGHFHYVGLGVKKNGKIALYWYKKAAEHGNAQAQYIVDNLYKNDVCTNRDLKQIIQEYERSNSNCQNQGKIINNRYYDPTKTFSVGAVIWPHGQNSFEEDHVEDAHYVSFRNDSDGLVRIEVINNISENNGTDSQRQIATLRDVFQYHLEGIEQIFPGTIVIETNEKNLKTLGQSLFAIIWIPKGSTLGDSDTGEALDSVRGYLLSFCEDQLVSVSKQEEFASSTNINRAQNNEEMYKQLIEIRKSYKKEHNN